MPVTELAGWYQTVLIAVDFALAQSTLRIDVFSPAGRAVHGGRRLRYRFPRSIRLTAAPAA